MVGGSLHFLLELDVWLSLRKDFSHLGDVVLHEMLVQRVSDLQSTDKRKCKYILITVGDLCEMILGEVDI